MIVNILRIIDKKMMNAMHDFYYAYEDKPKIFTLVAVLWFSLMVYSMYPFPGFMALFFLPAIVFMWLGHLYEWRVWFRANKQRETKIPRFFPLSVASYRKWMFFLAVVFAVIDRIFLKPIATETDFIKDQFYWFVAYQLIANVLGTVIFIELIRLVSKKGASWSNRKHVFCLVSVALSLFVISTAAILYSKKLF